MRTNILIIKSAVNAQDIAEVLKLRKIYEAQRARLEMVETELTKAEASIMARIQAGAPVVSPHEVCLKPVERRNIAWKGIVAELIGGERTEDILRNTEPTITYKLLIKESKEAS